MSTLKVDNIQNRVGTGAPTLTYGATIPSGQDLSVGGDLTVTGNLTVSGTTTTVNTTNTTVQDSLLELNSGATGSNSNDLGLIFERGSDVNVAFIWDESADKFTLGTTSAVGSATGNLTLAATGTLVANLEGSQSGGSVSATTITGSSDMNIGTGKLFVDQSEAAVGILTSAPGFPASHGVNSAVANCALDVCFGGAGATNDVPNISLYIGADAGAGGTSSRTDNTQKEFRIASPHYHNEQLPVIFAMVENLDTENRLHIGGATGSCTTPTSIGFKVNSANTVISSSNDPQLLLKGLTEHGGAATNYGRLELKNSSFSEGDEGSYTTDASGNIEFDLAKSTCFVRRITGTVTSFDLRNVDDANSRVHTATFFLTCTSDRTITAANGVHVNGTAMTLRFPGGGDQTIKANKVNIITIIIHTSAGGSHRAFATLIDDL